MCERGPIEELNTGTTAYADLRFLDGVNALDSAILRGCLGNTFFDEGYQGQFERLMAGEVAMIAGGSQVVSDLVTSHDVAAVDRFVADSGGLPILEGHALPPGLPAALVEVHEALAREAELWPGG
jgi:hypothetical protein